MKTDSAIIKRNAFWNSFGSIVYLGSQWLMTLLVVRMATNLDDAGCLNLAISLTSVFGTLAAFNMRTYIISDRNNLISSSEYAGFRICTCVVSFVCCLGYTAAFSYSSYQNAAIVLYLFIRLLEAVLDFVYAFEQKSERMDIGGKSMFARGLLSLASFAFSYGVFHDLCVSLVLVLLSYLVVFFFFDLPRSRPYCTLVPRCSKKYLILLRDGSLTTTTSFLSDLVVTYPRQVIEQACGIAALGAYASVAAPVVVAQVGISFIFNPLLPSLDKLYSSKCKKEYFRIIGKVVVSILVVFVAGLLLICLVGEPVLFALYGEEVSSYSYLLVTFLVAVCLNALQWFFRILLVMMRVFVPQLVVSIVTIILCVALSPVCVHQFGLIGANYVVVACYSFSTLFVLMSLIHASRQHFAEGR